MSVYGKVKVTNLATGQFLGYLGRLGPPHGLYPQLAQSPSGHPEPAGEITWTFKESDVKGHVGLPPGTERPTSAEGWARIGFAYLAIKNTTSDIVGEQLWLLCNGLNEWAKWSWTSHYTLLKWNENNTVTAEMPEGDLMLYVDKCDHTDYSYLRWGKATNPSVVRLDFE